MVLFDQMGIVDAYVWLSGFTEERNELFFFFFKARLSLY